MGNELIRRSLRPDEAEVRLDRTTDFQGIIYPDGYRLYYYESVNGQESLIGPVYLAKRVWGEVSFEVFCNKATAVLGISHVAGRDPSVSSITY